MKIFLITASIFGSLALFFASRQINDQTKYFEGELIYEVEYKSNIPDIPESYLEEYFGNKIRILIKNGSHLKQNFNSKNELLSESYVNLESGIEHNVTANNDTIYWVDITKEDSKSEIMQISDTVIRDHPCIHIKMNTKVTGRGLGDEISLISGDYFFSKELIVNPEWYANYKEGNFNEVIKFGKGITYESITKGELWITQKKLISFKSRKIKNEEIKFKEKNNSILKQL